MSIDACREGEGVIKTVSRDASIESGSGAEGKKDTGTEAQDLEAPGPSGVPGSTGSGQG